MFSTTVALFMSLSICWAYDVRNEQVFAFGQICATLYLPWKIQIESYDKKICHGLKDSSNKKLFQVEINTVIFSLSWLKKENICK